MVTIPFSFLPPKLLIKLSDKFMKLGGMFSAGVPYLQLDLDRADFKVKAKRYVAMCMVASLFLLFFLGTILTIFLVKIGKPYLGVVISILFSAMMFFLQINYPKTVAHRRIRRLDADLLPALQAIMIQLNSGVPLFEAIVIISKQEFGEVSLEFSKAVKNIHGGVPQIAALEAMALQNPSLYFRRAIWQIINGMKEGSTINEVMERVIENLTQEQVIQIEKYGSQLNPLAMFYMMGAVILPTLAITFFIVLASFIGLSDLLVKGVFVGLLCFVVFFQIIFSGIIKTKRPSLLGD
jgi:Flp pilus assembly protein TadB